MTVAISLDPRGIIIQGAQTDDEPLVWPYPALSAEPTLTAATDAASITYSHLPDASLWIGDAAFLQKLREAAPTTRAGRQRMRWLGAIAAIIVLFVGIGLLVQLANIRVLGATASLIPQSARTAMGQQVAKQISSRYPNCINPKGRAVLQKLVARVHGATTAKSTPIEGGVLNWRIANAFTAPGGVIYLTRGLIQQATTSDEVAGVLAHEIGHAVELHPEVNVLRRIGLTAFIQIMTGGGTVAGLGEMLVANSFSRNDEREADAIAVRLLHEADISHKPLMAFFERSKRSASVVDLMSTHPASEERLATLKAIPAPLAVRDALTGSEWRDLRNICRKLDR